MDAVDWGHAVHFGLLALALAYIVAFDSYCGISGDPRCYGPAAVDADAVDLGELEDVGPLEEIAAVETDASDLADANSQQESAAPSMP